MRTALVWALGGLPAAPSATWVPFPDGLAWLGLGLMAATMVDDEETAFIESFGEAIETIGGGWAASGRVRAERHYRGAPAAMGEKACAPLRL